MMKLTKQEYEELIANLEFLNDKVENCYKQETDTIVKKLKEEYKKFVCQ